MTETPDVSNSVAFFSRYDKTFQEKIFQALLMDRDWAAQMLEVMTPEYFELKYLRYLSTLYFQHYKKHRTFPTLSLLASIVKEDLREGNGKILQQQIVDYLHRAKFNPDYGDLPKVKEMALNFCRKQAMKVALEEAVDLIETGKHEQVVKVMRDAVAVGIPASVGHDFKEDFEARFVKMDRKPCPTGLPQLDQPSVLNGGLGRGEIGVITANTGVGKSHFLVNIGAEALKRGKNVLHYTFELTETAVGLRYDSHLCEIPSNEVQDQKELVKNKYENMELGRLIIKEYPTGFATVFTIRSHIEKLMMKSFMPSLIIIDYADIMRSTRRYDSMRHELKLIYEELRNLAQDLNIPIWTASQANRDSANSDVVGLENMSEAYGKAMVADVVISLSRKAKEKSTGYGRMFVAKNRAGRDGLLFHVKMNTAQSRIEVLDPNEESTLLEANQESESELKDKLAAKWKELKSDK
jgi:replicative DNA helicase